MAGELKGKAYEALVKLVLEDLSRSGKLHGSIFWDLKPCGMTITPDITIGESADEPTCAILVTHSESSKNSTFKSWRNLGELSEFKVFLPVSPRVVSLIFDSAVYPVLKKLGDASFDGQLIIGDKHYGKTLLNWVERQLKGLPKEKNAKVTALRQSLHSDPKCTRALISLRDDIATLIKKVPPEPLRALWEMEKHRARPTPPKPKVTLVRRGLCKLLLFPDMDAALRLYTNRRVKQEEIPPFIYELGLAGRSIAGAAPSDHDVAALVDLFPRKTLLLILAEIRNVSTHGFWSQLAKVKNIALLDTLFAYVVKRRSLLSTASGMLDLLQKLHANPSQGIKIPSGLNAPDNVWIFDVVGALVKATANKSQDFGFSSFTKHKGAKSAKIGSMWVGDWCTCFFNQYLTRKPGFKIPDSALQHAATVLSEALAGLDGATIQSLKNKVLQKYVAKEFEATLLSHRGFDPLHACIRAAGITGMIVNIRSCFGERAKLSGVASQTTIMNVGSTFINWQSVSDAGRDHKKKELCGRAVALRYTWNDETEKFMPRPDLKKLMLVVDGTWRASDLASLSRAGWDEIFYPDEMDKLANAIV